ncbi:MAG TPA: glycerate kinase, partial [Bacteroidetes bacterium]|nr:glycerate kinase [Bacteroidota bacterium]
KRQQHAPSTTTFGTGELIADAMEKGAKKIFLFVGGSATNDAGIGMAQALGYRFLNKSGDELKPIGASLNKIATITGKPNKKIATTEFILVSDVKNPLYGENGAAKIFARQKGADSDEIDSLDQGLKNFAKVMEEKFNKNISHTPGAGAAGGLGAGAIVFLNAKAKNGIKTIMDIVNFDKYIKDADFVISGEGKFDTQTLEGKVVQGVIEKCMLFDKQLGIICGISELQLDDLNKTPVKIIAPIMNGQVDQKTAFSEARKLVSIRAKEIMQILV